jgi:hypothetical protein
MIPKPRRVCIFCGRPGLTKEHMWADWLRNYIPRERQEHRVGSTNISLAQHEDSVQDRIERRSGDPHSRRIRCVCRECNNGWMSQLQEAAKPFLVPMLTGQKVALYESGKTTLASWAAMFVMVAEQVDQTKVAISAVERQWLREKRRPSSYWRIWIGQHRREAHPLFVHNVLPFASKEEVERPPRGPVAETNTQTSTICLGQHLLIHVMSSQIAWSIIRRWKLPAQIEPVMSQIWPVRAGAVKWPPPAALTDDDIHLLAQQFFTVATNLAREKLGTI